MFAINPFSAIKEAFQLFTQVLIWFVVFAPYFIMGSVVQSPWILGLQVLLGIVVFGILNLSLEAVYSGEKQSLGTVVDNFFSNFKTYCKRYCFLMLTAIFWGIIFGGGLILAMIIMQVGTELRAVASYKVVFQIASMVVGGITFIIMVMKFLLPMFIAIPHLFIGANPERVWRESKKLVFGHRLSLFISLSIFAIPSGIVIGAIQARSLSLAFLMLPAFFSALNSIVAFVYYKRIVALEEGSEGQESDAGDNVIKGELGSANV